MEYRPELIIDEREDVYPPSEDSILLIESLDVRPGERILEIGCGSGVVSIHCAVNGADVTAVDINPSAVKLTKENASKNNVPVRVMYSDLFENVEGRFDTIFFNLPYLPVDDEGILAKAWSGGADGMGPLPRLLDEMDKYIVQNGRLLIVVSSLMDRDRLNDLLSCYDVIVKGTLSLFFEKLEVLEIHRK